MYLSDSGQSWQMLQSDWPVCIRGRSLAKGLVFEKRCFCGSKKEEDAKTDKSREENVVIETERT